jgi:ABC-type lipoprotein export system ATPase subunit
LRERGLAKLMSSDAHSIAKLGVDQATRTLTRLRMDDFNFEALRNAIVNNPKARCKAEVVLPATYPRVTRAEFEGGFLDGVSLEFSPNLNCIIGGRGSGKSTALLAICAALGAESGDEDVDEAERMPDRTQVHFIDSTGSARVAVRVRGEPPVDAESGSPIRLRLADLAQEESARLSRQAEERPETLLAFLDSFVIKHKNNEAETGLLSKLADNATEVERTAVGNEQIEKMEQEQARLQGNLDAAEKGQIEEIARWASLLAAQGPFLARLDDELRKSATLGDDSPAIDIDELAASYGVNLASARAVKFIEGEDGLRVRLDAYARARGEIRTTAEESMATARQTAQDALDLWKKDQEDLRANLDTKQKELEAKGLKVQAGAVREIADRLNDVKKTLAQLRQRAIEHKAAQERRRELLANLQTNRNELCSLRRSTLGQIVAAANRQSDGRLSLRVTFVQGGIDQAWVRWLGTTFGFRAPRVQRVAASISPQDFAHCLINNVPHLVALADDSGSFFTEEALSPLYKWPTLFELETMRLEDMPRVQVREAVSAEWKAFSRLSVGQQHSVLLSLMLCADRYEPLILDQPEDHLDAQYIATGVVRHLEGAKERRQLILATHSANLTVLGDAELVVPLRVEGGKGQPYDIGAIDRPSTRTQVCALLEGGIEAYERRGLKYGFQFSARPPSA